VVPSIRPATFAGTVALAAQSSCVRVALGVHPQVVHALPTTNGGRRAGRPPWPRRARVAVGECASTALADSAGQEALFRAQIRIARAVGCRSSSMFFAPTILPRASSPRSAPARSEASSQLLRGRSWCRSTPTSASRSRFAGPVTYRGSRRPVAAARRVPAALLLPRPTPPTRRPNRIAAPLRAGFRARRDRRTGPRPRRRRRHDRRADHP